MYTDYQAGYLAHWLSLEGKAEETLTQTIASAKVDMNPHQVQAALFALESPLSQGVILADEVVEANSFNFPVWQADESQGLCQFLIQFQRRWWNRVYSNGQILIGGTI